MDEKGVTVAYLAKLTGVSAQVIRKDVRLLQSIVAEDNPLLEAGY